MWGTPTIVAGRDGKLIAIVLLDTQGAFDHKTALNETTKIFGVSAGLSSVLVSGNFSKILINFFYL